MIKKVLLAFACLSVIFSGYSGEIDLRSKALLQRKAISKNGPTYPAEQRKRGTNKFIQRAKPTPAIQENSGYSRAFVTLNPGYTTADLEAAGMQVNVEKGNIIIVTLPTDSVLPFSQLDCIKKLRLETPLDTHIDKAREDTGVDDLHSGKGLDLPYKGKGVLAAVIDQGVDPNHISFLDDEGKSRVKYLTYYDGTATSDGYPRTQYYGDDIYYIDNNGKVQYYPTISQFYTDVNSAYHGTHTLNILGGGYHGDITVSNGNTEEKIENPYYGVAYEADLAVSCGELSDACVAMGLAEILSYADYRKEKEGMPSVVSISLGSSAGAHDPHGTMNEFLEYCGEESIIVVSAGNEGDLKIAYNKTMTEEDNSFKTLIYPYGYRYEKGEGAPSESNTYYRNGVVMIYSDDATPFTIQGFIMTGEPGNYRKRASFNISGNDGNYYSSDSYYTSYVGGTVNSTVAKYFDGYIGGGSMLDKELNRYYGAFDYYLVTNPETGINEDGSEAAIVGFEIIAEDGRRIDCYCDGVNTWLSDYGMEGYADGQRDGTISDMAVGENILVVGAYTTRCDWVALDGQKYAYTEEDGFEMGDIGQYSSYGTLADGRTLPHVCAPGSGIISAVSTPWIDYYFDGYPDYIAMNTTAKATVDGTDYYWKPETGTSMSTPFVAGSIALWLEADPELTIDDVKEIIAKTAVKDDFVKNGIPSQWGAGKFDALAGLKEVISRKGAGITGPQSERLERLIVEKRSPKEYSVFLGNTSGLDVSVYSIGGNRVYGRSFIGNEAILDLSSLSPGVYILKVNTQSVKLAIN